MKKRKSKPVRWGSGAPKSSVPKSVDEYFTRVQEPARSRLAELRATIRSAVPPDTSEIISYQMPAFKKDKVLVWYAAFTSHCSLFPTSSVVETFKTELKGFSTSKGTIQFPIDKRLPVALIKKIVTARVAQIEKNTRH